MSIRTWDGSTNRFDSAADWSPAGVPQPGDIALINSGTVTASGGTLQGLAIVSAGGFNLGDGTTLAPDTRLTVSGTGGLNTLNTVGQVGNQGIVTVRGSINVFSATGPTGIAGVLRNTGTINVVDGPALLVGLGRPPFGSIENDGVISVWNPSAGAAVANLASLRSGTGTVQLFEQAHVVAAPPGPGQTYRFIAGAGRATSLTVNELVVFQGRIAGFAAPDTITLFGRAVTSAAYASTGAASGVLTLSDNGTLVASIAFDGAYQQSDFTVTTTTPNGSSIPSTDITTKVAPPTQDIELKDVTLGLASFDAAGAYAGPVGGLQRQYIWAGNDQAGIAALSPNAFLKGGPGDDALLVTGGSNVLDGGGGSNFMAGGTGADGGTDTFFVDGRNGPGWSSILNFHPGDAMTLFGFQAGRSTFSWTAADGAGGFQGATIHADLGDGANVSVTFARVDFAEAQNRFTLSTGSTGGVGYLNVAYTA